ncbi:MAG: SagB family peptide dehydrogenase [Legionellales bacterium]|nr:SagB family peptide dehydrogenase [Legionellales bacterium]
MDKKLNHLNVQDLCYASTAGLINRNLYSTGVRVDSAMLQNDCIDEISEHFLLNSSIETNELERVYTINKYLTYPFTSLTALSNKTVYTGLIKIDLPKPTTLDLKFDLAVKQRTSIRHYSGDYIPINYLSSVLFASQGVSHISSYENEPDRMQRTYPSGGGLYPVKLYILVNRVKKLERGIYYYNPLAHNLYSINRNQDEINDFLKSESINELPNIEHCSFTLFFTIESWRSMTKYGSAGLRFSYIELGEIAQMAHLASGCLGIGSCAYASFSPERVIQLLKIDGQYESFQHAILHGISA